MGVVKGAKRRTIEPGESERRDDEEKRGRRSGKPDPEKKKLSKCEQEKVREKKRNEGEWDNTPTGFRSLPTLCLPAGERFRSAVPKLPSGGFHSLCVCACVCRSV